MKNDVTDFQLQETLCLFSDFYCKINDVINVVDLFHLPMQLHGFAENKILLKILRNRIWTNSDLYILFINKNE